MTFGERPKYKALSYTWGSELVTKKIMINGKDFEVRCNLWDALVQLRSRTEERSLWIDAVCINQADILERNQQVRFMPHIYSRAQMVLIWLGAADMSLIDHVKWSILFHDSYPDTSIEGYEELIFNICNREYWNRVWIIQEIGKARRIKIHYGSRSTDWNTFINVIKNREAVADCMPLKLAKQLLNKYNGGRKLHNLLETYQTALCKDPRDKIYGFTGLATDCQGRLPIDYGKTLFEVWRDVVIFKITDRDAPQHDILRFARLVQHLLGGPGIIKAEELIREKMLVKTMDGRIPPDFGLDPSKTSMIKVPALVSGKIMHLGPTYKEVISNIQEVDDWTSRIKDCITECQLPSAYEESDLFLEVLEQLDDSDLEPISNFDRIISYRLEDIPQSLHSTRFCAPCYPESQDLLTSDMRQSVTELNKEPRLFLLDTDRYGPSGQGAMIGLAPPAAQIGDFICHLYQMDRAVIMRKRGFEFQLVGTAVLAEDCATARRTKEGNLRKAARFGIPNDGQVLQIDAVDLYMDFPSVFEWPL